MVCQFSVTYYFTVTLCTNKLLLPVSWPKLSTGLSRNRIVRKIFSRYGKDREVGKDLKFREILGFYFAQTQNIFLLGLISPGRDVSNEFKVI